MGKEENHHRELMIKRLFDMLLLLINSIGIVGSFMQILEIPWDSAWDRIVFWGVLFFFCAFSVLLMHKADGKRVLRRGCICMLPYGILAYFYRKTLSGGLVLALQNAAATLNGRYQFHIPWPNGLAILQEAGWESGLEIWIITISILFFLFPLVLLAGLLLARGGCFWLFLGNALWLIAACACNRFPDVFFLVFCVMGAVALLVENQFEESSGAGICAAACVMLLAGFSIGLICRFLLPITDMKYEEGYAGRARFYKLVNDEWIPALKGMLPSYGFGSGTDVTGVFNRQTLLADASGDVYQVTVDAIPSETLYLKGYVGVTYGKKEWAAQSDKELKTYYEKHGLELPEDFRQLANISYEAIRASQEKFSGGEVRIRELGSKGSYSVYPYGAYLTEDYQVHGDGSVKRKGREYSFPYRSLSRLLEAGALPEPWRTMEEQYRQYVYASFLEYPESLELLAEHLEQANIRTQNVSLCVSDIVEFLKRQASYNLDAGKNPRGEDFVEYFLFECHEGYCVHFASAAVLALRYFGIPARYVTGYVVSPSDFSKDEDGAYTAMVTGRQAHAWAEIYLDGKGWTPVEATPGTAALPGDGSLGLLAGGDGTPLPAVNPGAQAARRLQTERFPESVEPEAKEPSEAPEMELVHADFPKEQDMAKPGGILDDPGKKESAMPLPEPGNGDGEFQGSAGEQGIAGLDEPDGKILRAAGTVISMFIDVLLLAGIWFMGKYLRNAGNRRWRNALQKAGARACILLLYRNMRKALRVAGCPGDLEAEGDAFWQALRKAHPGVKREEYESFYAILENVSFGNTEPSDEEVGKVYLLHDGLVKEVYERTPFYKKPLFGILRCYRK